MILILLSCIAAGCNGQSSNIEQTSDLFHSDANSFQRLDRASDADLSGLTFYVWGEFPEFIAGVNVGHSEIVVQKILARGGAISEDVNDPNIDVAIVGEAEKNPFLYLSDTISASRIEVYLVEEHNRERYSIVAALIDSEVEIISGEVFFARIAQGFYYDPEDPDRLDHSVWSHIDQR